MKTLCRAILPLCGVIFASYTSAFAADAKQTWQRTWEKTLAAAKKEGKLNFYVGRYGTEPLLNEFRKEFPEIQLVTVNGTGNSLGTRIIAEIRAGKFVADLFSGGANTNYEVLYQGKALDSIKSALILPEVLDESKWYEGKHRYTDPEQRHIFVYIANPSSSGFYYNTNLVSPKEFKSYWDLVTPKWKGKYVSQEPTSTGLGGGLQFMYYHPELGPEFIKRLFKGGPNPNAARVFINWFLSRRGQIAMQKYNDLYGEDAPNSRRLDIPKDMLVPHNRMTSGKKYFDVSDPKYADMTPMFNLVKEIMKEKQGK